MLRKSNFQRHFPPCRILALRKGRKTPHYAQFISRIATDPSTYTFTSSYYMHNISIMSKSAQLNPSHTYIQRHMYKQRTHVTCVTRAPPCRLTICVHRQKMQPHTLPIPSTHLTHSAFLPSHHPFRKPSNPKHEKTKPTTGQNYLP